MKSIKADICIIGAGSAGLSVAAGASQMGASAVLIEKGKMGGDCLNTGCVPSKALIAAASAAHAPSISEPFGIHLSAARTDFDRVHAHIRGVIAKIAPVDSVERFEGLGVNVIKETARFVSAREVQAGDHAVKARRFVIATGSAPAIPPIPGLQSVPYLTNESLFELTTCPSHLVIIGGGPIGIEMAQAFRRLGADVTVVDQASILAMDDPEAVEVVRRALLSEGVTLFENARIEAVRAASSGIEAAIRGNDGGQIQAQGSHLLIAAGRKPRVDGLNLEAAGVTYTSNGIKVDARLRTANRKIFAIGDCAGGPQFTHAAGYHAGIVIRNALLGLPAKTDYSALPRVTYTDPELAHVGLTGLEAERLGHKTKILTSLFAENDRAQAERRTEGLAKIVLGRKGKILGATIAGPHAGELILLWGLAISAGLKISKIASLIAPYPTLSEVSKRAAGSFYTPALFSSRTRKIVKLIQRVLP